MIMQQKTQRPVQFGSAGMVVFSFALGFTPILFAAFGSRFLNPG